MNLQSYIISKAKCSSVSAHTQSIDPLLAAFHNSDDTLTFIRACMYSLYYAYQSWSSSELCSLVHRTIVARKYWAHSWDANRHRWMQCLQIIFTPADKEITVIKRANNAKGETVTLSLWCRAPMAATAVLHLARTYVPLLA